MPLTVSASTSPVNNNLYWSGTNWYVPSAHSNTWVDDQNNLHMRLEKINNKWCGCLLERSQTVKYGKFTWVSSSSTLNLERYTTIGLFTYHDDQNELDIEINQWPGCDEHLYFVNQPGSVDTHPEKVSYGVFSSNPHLNDKNIVYSIEWTPDYVYYSAIAEDGTIIQDWTYSNPEGIPSINSTICMDLLPLAGSYYPASGNAAEVVLQSFTYTPYESSWKEQTVQKPVSDFSSNVISGTTPLKVAFTDRSTGTPTSWNWNFGDGTSSKEKNPTHTYSIAGPYTVKLTVSNAAGSNTATKTNYISAGVTAQKPVVNFWGTPRSGNAPLSVTFKDITTGAPTTWNWDFGDGTSSTEQNPTHVYSAAGNYIIKLTASNAAGSTVLSKYNYIKVTGTAAQTPIASFNSNVNSGNAPLNVLFTDTSTGTPTAWSWNFGDGASSTQKNPTHTYSAAGSYTVTLTVNNAAGSNTVTKSSYITVTGTTAQKPVINCWGSPRTGNAPLNVFFKDSSTGSPTSWNWNFGDGTSSTLQNPKHTYSAAGSYTIKLTVTNAAGSTTTTKNNYIIVSKA